MKRYEKHVSTEFHLEFSITVLNEHCVKNPQLSSAEDKSKNHINNHNNRPILYFIECEWELVFVDSFRLVKSSVILKFGYPDQDLSNYLTRKIKYFKNCETFHINQKVK